MANGSEDDNTKIPPDCGVPKGSVVLIVMTGVRLVVTIKTEACCAVKHTGGEDEEVSSGPLTTPGNIGVATVTLEMRFRCRSTTQRSLID